jgi:hypothetical protein
LCDVSDDSHDDISFEDHQFPVITFEKFHFLAFFFKVLFPFLVTFFIKFSELYRVLSSEEGRGY